MPTISNIPPDQMTADERLDEVARILAAGFRRLRKKINRLSRRTRREFPGLRLPGRAVMGPDRRENGGPDDTNGAGAGRGAQYDIDG